MTAMTRQTGNLRWVRAGILALGFGAVTPLSAQTIAITGATVYPASGPKISNGTIVIQDGRIRAVGANVAVPAGATRIDATGKWITPGLIHANAGAGLGVAGLNGQQEGGVQGEVNPRSILPKA
jgi:imidazolonepropionase-like amidohydrolase